MIILEESHNGEVIVYEANKDKLKDIVITKLCESDYNENDSFEDKLYNYSIDFKTFKTFDNYTDLWEFKKSIVNITNTKIPNEIINFLDNENYYFAWVTGPDGRIHYFDIFNNTKEAISFLEDFGYSEMLMTHWANSIKDIESDNYDYFYEKLITYIED